MARKNTAKCNEPMRQMLVCGFGGPWVDGGWDWILEPLDLGPTLGLGRWLGFSQMCVTRTRMNKAELLDASGEQ